MDTEKLLGFGNGARTLTAKVGKIDPENTGASKLVGFERGARIVTAKVGKVIDVDPDPIAPAR